MKTQQRVGALQDRKRALIRTQTLQDLDLGGFASSRTVENKLVLFKLPGLWYFVTAALEY